MVAEDVARTCHYACWLMYGFFVRLLGWNAGLSQQRINRQQQELSFPLFYKRGTDYLYGLKSSTTYIVIRSILPLPIMHLIDTSYATMRA
jgi:hypothetical protein